MSQYDDALTAAEQKYGLPSGLLHGLMHTESRGNPNARSPKGAVGLMQFMPATAKQYGVDPSDPAQSIDGAARLMRDNLKAAKGNVGEALRIYQGGTKLSARGPENAAYAGKVLGAMPGDSGDLAAMGFGAPPKADAPDLASAGLSATPDDAVAKARQELDSYTTAPAPDKMTQDVNAIIKSGVASGRDPARIKQDVAVYWAQQGRDPTKGGTGIDGAINYYRHNGGGAVPVVVPARVAKPNALQRLGAGLRQGVEDVDSTFDPMAQAIARRAPAIDQFGGKLGFATADQAANVHSQDRALFNATVGNDTMANIGRIGGDVGASAPLIMGGNMLAGRAAAALPEAAAPVTSFIAGNGGGNLLARGASLATHGAAEGVMGSAAVSGGNDAPLMEQLEMGGAAGALLGPAGRLAAKGGGAAVNALAPKVNPIVAQLAQKAVDMGIDIDGGQISSSPFVHTMRSVLKRVPGSGMAAADDNLKDQFTQAVGRTFGADSPRLTDDVMDNAKTKLGSVFDTVAKRTRIVGDDQLIDDLGRVESEAPQALADTEARPVLKQINNILAKLDEQGHIDGDTYQALTRKGAPLDVAMSNHDSNISHYASQIREALDSALERSASPADLDALRAARLGWKNMRTVEPLVAKSTDGTISPALLKNRVVQNFKQSAYKGAGDLGDLADIGQRFLKDQGSSNTAERSQQFNMLANIAKVGGGAAATMLGLKAGISPGEIGAMVGAAGTTAGAGRITANTIRSDWYRNRLLNAALDNDKTGGVVAPWLSESLLPLTVAGGNRLLQSSAPSSR